MKNPANFIDRTNHQYGRWTVIKRTDHIKNVKWLCKCQCGTIKEVLSCSLSTGKSKSCGCISTEKKGTTFIGKNKREYRSWMGIKQRCYYKNHIEYHRYGGRGISMCELWRNDFVNFFNDMGECPDGYSIDRIDNDGMYCKENCKWSSKAEQSANTSRNVFVYYEGEKYTLKALAQHLGLNYQRLHPNYKRNGCNIEEAIIKTRSIGRPRNKSI